VNNAGITGRTTLAGSSNRNEVREVFDVNFMGPFLFCQGLGSQFARARYGRIVNVASDRRQEGNPTLLPYSASKAAVIALTKSLARSSREKGTSRSTHLASGDQDRDLEGVAPSTVEYMISRFRSGEQEPSTKLPLWSHYLVECGSKFYDRPSADDISGGRATLLISPRVREKPPSRYHGAGVDRARRSERSGRP